MAAATHNPQHGNPRPVRPACGPRMPGKWLSRRKAAQWQLVRRHRAREADRKTRVLTRLAHRLRQIALAGEIDGTAGIAAG